MSFTVGTRHTRVNSTPCAPFINKHQAFQEGINENRLPHSAAAMSLPMTATPLVMPMRMKAMKDNAAQVPLRDKAKKDRPSEGRRRHEGQGHAEPN